MAARVLVDTSALLALASPDDQYHRIAVEAARRYLAGQGRFVGTTLIIGELHARLLYRRGPSEARRIIGTLLRDPAHEWQDTTADIVEAALTGWLGRFADQRFSLCDAVSFEVMRRERIRTAFAFDQHFVTAGFTLLGPPAAR